MAVTAYARADDRRRLLLAGYQMHISKPVEPQELVAGIASLVGLTSRNAAFKRAAGDGALQLELRSLTVWRSLMQ